MARVLFEDTPKMSFYLLDKLDKIHVKQQNVYWQNMSFIYFWGVGGGGPGAATNFPTNNKLGQYAIAREFANGFRQAAPDSHLPGSSTFNSPTVVTMDDDKTQFSCSWWGVVSQNPD